MKLGWVGVGKMGLPMASHLLAAGQSVTACDALPQPCRQSWRGARGAHTGRGARDAEIVFSSIPDDNALRAVALGDAAFWPARGPARYT